MKPLRLLPALILLSAWISTYPKTVNFSYDYAGNRIKREITIPKNNMPKKDSSDSENIKDELSGKKVNITVDPQNGTIRVQISHYNSSDIIKLNVFDISGHAIYNSEIISELTTVDITQRPSGIYIMLINVNGESISYKLIKE